MNSFAVKTSEKIFEEIESKVWFFVLGNLSSQLILFLAVFAFVKKTKGEVKVFLK